MENIRFITSEKLNIYMLDENAKFKVESTGFLCSRNRSNSSIEGRAGPAASGLASRSSCEDPRRIQRFQSLECQWVVLVAVVIVIVTYEEVFTAIDAANEQGVGR